MNCFNNKGILSADMLPVPLSRPQYKYRMQLLFQVQVLNSKPATGHCCTAGTNVCSKVTLCIANIQRVSTVV